MAEAIQLGSVVHGSAKASTNADSASFDVELSGPPSEAWRTEFATRLVSGGVSCTFVQRTPGRADQLLRIVCSAPEEVKQILPKVTRAVADTNAEMAQREDKRAKERTEKADKRAELERAINEELSKA